ncbi:SusC/RagA family TonB-linked outer membrane protein [Ferruginibacter sp. SUN106]|uniref:SusC/RagA family TonB-linked outer membrane protein n=1 Tax=Ferruginibacter sp. SUN106 TaxID=2978348 RepID=UPI003D3668AE
MKVLITKISFLLFAICFANGVMAQATTTTIQGKILGVNKKPVEHVTIAEVDADGRTIHAVKTDVEGNFVIKISSPKNKLSISHISFRTQVLPINTRTTFNINMESNSKDLGDVVVVSQRKVDNGNVAIPERELTTAQSHIAAKDLEEMQAASIDQALQGRLPGVDITANSGDPGAGMQIRIRGTSSINSSNDPLIVVDGMPYETSVPSDFNFGSADEQGYASLINIAPTDIKDITILKDAAATAVWGSRAANGVVVITTKRGAIGKPAFTYTNKTSITKQPEAIPMLTGDQYSTLIPEAYMNATGTALNTQNVKEFQYDPNDPYWYNNYSKNTNWIKAITQTGVTQDHNISMTGGGEKARYYASLGYLDQKGTTIGTYLKRISTRINLDYIVSERIRFKSDLSYSYTDNNRNFALNLRDLAYRKMPNMSIYEYDEYGNLSGNYFSPANNIQGQYLGLDTKSNIVGTSNPVALAKEAKYNIISQRITPHFNLQYEILKKVLMATFDVQFDINNNKNNSFLPQTATGRPWTEPSVNRAYDGDIDVFNVQSKTNLVYTPKFKSPNHSLISFLSLSTYDNKYVSQEILASNTASSVLQDPSSPGRTQNAETKLTAYTGQTRSIGLLVNAQYGYKDRYIFNVGVRGDGNSRFGPENRYALFPSASIRWRVSDEKFMKRFQKKIDDLSFRASYGESGNAPKRDYSYINTYNTFGWTYLGQAGVYPANMQLSNLKWETIVGQNAGINLSMFKRRFTVDAEFYVNRTKNMYFPGLQISSINGFSNVDMNVGTMDNQGFELGLGVTPYKSKTWQVDFNFNIARNINMIREISDLYPLDKGDITTNGTYKTFLQVNNPFGSFYGFKYKGVYKDVASTIATDASGKNIVGPTGQTIFMKFNYPSIGYTFQPGDAMYEDINHDGNINYQDIVYLGNSNPKYTGGFGTSVTYKGAWKFTAFFNYRYKVDLVNGTKILTTNMYGFDNQSTATLRRWRKDGDITDIPRALYRTGYNWLGSDRYVEDGSFLRFRTATVRYTAPKKFVQKLKVKNLSAYVTVENLFTWTNYTGQDPEASVRGSDPFRVAVDNSYTPPVKTFTVGVTASF